MSVDVDFRLALQVGLGDLLALLRGLGQHVASIDSFAYADWERRNPGITGDKDWLHGLLRDNPECRVESTSSKTRVSFAGVSSDSVSEPTTKNSAPVANFA